MSYPGYGTDGGYPPATASAPPPAGYPPPTQPGYPPAQQQAPGYPPANKPGYPSAQQQAPGYPPAGGQSYQGQGYLPVTNESYQTRVQQPSAAPTPPPGASGGYTQPPPPADKYAVPPDGQDPSNAPSAPPMEKMDLISGYAGNNFETDASIAPPSYEEATRPPPQRNDHAFRVPVIDEDTARKALLNEVGKHCCWGKGPAERLKFLDLQSTSAIHYILETFTEGRSTKWTHEPYLGQPLDSPAYGPAPLPWDIQVPAPTLFTSNVHKCEVPHTASLKPCHSCFGMGRRKCHHCLGTGSARCHHCNGSGRTHHHHNHHGHHGNNHHHGHRHHHNQCSHCNGLGRARCGPCLGQGSKQCDTCQGRAQLKCFIQLTVTRNNRYEDFVVDQTKLPIEMLRKVNGDVAFQEEYPRVYPLTNYPDRKINQASQDLVRKHSTAFQNERTLMQRHRVRIIPITEVHYKHNNHEGKYHVFGIENEVYIKDYPSTCCGCCVIL